MKIQEIKKGGEMMGSVVMYTNYLATQVLSVIRRGDIHVVVILGMESVVTRQTIVLARIVKTSNLQNGGGSQKLNRSGEMMEDVVTTTVYLMVQLPNVTLTGITRVVLILGMGFVLTRQ